MSDFYRDRKSKVITFMKKKGYLILIGLLLFSLAIALIIGVINSSKKRLAVKEIEQIPQEALPFKDENRLVEIPTVITEAEEENPEKLLFNPPVYCNISHDFSGTVPVFSESMKDWRLHQGVDYQTEEPLEVRACAEGIVEDVYFDGLMGQTVVIVHPDGTKTVYQSLSEKLNVIKGQTVKSADVIGYTSDTAASESDRRVHLHFAVIKDGKYIDPKTLFN